MKLTNCPACRQQVSPKAAACPSCGHPVRPKQFGVRLFFGIVFMLALVAAAMTPLRSFDAAHLAALLGIIAVLSAQIIADV